METSEKDVDLVTCPLAPLEMACEIRCLFDEMEVIQEEEDYVEKHYVDLGDLALAREHAERYRKQLGDQGIVEQRNTRVIFTFVNPPPLI